MSVHCDRDLDYWEANVERSDQGEDSQGDADSAEKEESVGESDSVEEVLREQWEQEQEKLREKIEVSDSRQLGRGELTYFGGLDISFIKDDPINACACYVVVNNNFEVVFKKLRMVKMLSPYIAGFLGFREAGELCKLVEEQRNECPELTPGVLMVDGNGVLHPRKCGTACHVALASGLPTLGVAKNLHRIDQLDDGYSRHEIREKFAAFTHAGEHLLLKTKEGEVLGAALKTTPSSTNPVYVSVGSGVSLNTAISLVINTARHRVPEPIRQADLLSREFLRLVHPTEKQKQAVREQGKKKRKVQKKEL